MTELASAGRAAAFRAAAFRVAARRLAIAVSLAGRLLRRPRGSLFA